MRCKSPSVKVEANLRTLIHWIDLNANPMKRALPCQIVRAKNYGNAFSVKRFSDFLKLSFIKFLLLIWIIWKGFTYSESYRNRHEKRCPSRIFLNQSAVRADSSVESTQAISLEHGKHKRYKNIPLECEICRVVIFISYFM